MKSRKVQIVEVHWEDIVGYGSEWREADTVNECVHAECRTVGYLWTRGKYLKIVGTVTEDCGVSDVTVIPSGVVKKIETLGTRTIKVK